VCGLHDQDELAALGDKMKMWLDNFHQVEWRSLTLWSCDFVVRMKGVCFCLHVAVMRWTWVYPPVLVPKLLWLPGKSEVISPVKKMI